MYLIISAGNGWHDLGKHTCISKPSIDVNVIVQKTVV